ncbi:phosphoribosylformylglycinamidine synthase [Candidatus Gottesmanbacteria bacterium]|nr:phosphoribosylformylglycinamidine synthase [Candidatus Gottesmanbacteria bacterium]
METVTRIEVVTTVCDSRAFVLYKRLVSDGFRLARVRITDVYTIDKKFAAGELAKITSLLAHPLTQRASHTMPLSPATFSWAIEIGYLPGVTDNVAATVREMIEDFTGKPFGHHEGVYTSRVMFFSGSLTESEVTRIAERLYNPLIERASVKSFAAFQKDNGMGKNIPRVVLSAPPAADEVSLSVSDKELASIGTLGVANRNGTRRGPLALDISSMKTIRAYFRKRKRNPTDVELESLAQTWSEHCKHTIFNSPIDDIKEGLFRRYIKGATERIRKKKGKRDFCVSVFSDNSGAIVFDKQFLVTHKVETHNSPSALDPFGGALTGIVGVNRDAIGFGLGAKPVINTYGFCLADPRDKTILFRDLNKTQPMLSEARIMEGVVAGVNSGGNCSGIPTPQGFLYFDRRFRGKPLVFVGTVGLIPKIVSGRRSYEKKARPGDYIVMVGGRVGLDGIHGATFSSQALTSGSPATAVQIGDPITQKKFSDAIVGEARDMGLFHSITDNGAGGLSCSVAEMAKESGGCLVELEKVPLKYPGLAAWQIWISESQERMTLAVPKHKWQALSRLLKRHGVVATVIGTFTRSGRCVVTYRGTTVMDVDIKFLHDGLPARQMRTKPMPAVRRSPKLPHASDLTHLFLSMLSRPNISSFSFISRQYDHEVQGSSVLKPLQGRGKVNADATVTRPVLSSLRGIVLSQGLYPSYSDIDPYRMAACSLDTAVRNIVAAGADPDRIALLDNFCWCSSQDPGRLWQLKQAAKACYDYAVAYGTPFISGKDSMFNDFTGFDAQGKPVAISIPPTLLISAIGVVADSTKVVSLDAKFPGDLVYLLGETYDEVGGINAKTNRKLYFALSSAIQRGLVASSQSVHRGGVAVAIAKTALAGLYGVDVTIDRAPFSESQGRIVVTVAPQNARAFENVMTGNAYACIGSVTERKRILMKDHGGRVIVDSSLHYAQRSYLSTFKEY